MLTMARIDLGLLKYETYAQYVKSFIRAEDYRYFSNFNSLQKLVKLGYRCSAKVYEEDEFIDTRAKIYDYFNPKITSRVLYSKYLKGNDAALQGLADREEANLLLKLSTIIFLQVRMSSGFDISGYIDYEKSLRDCSQKKPEHTRWKDVFEGRVLLRPKPTDLSYYDWHSGAVFSTDSDNWQTVAGSKNLIFMNKADHKLVPVTENVKKHSENVQRTMVLSELYGHMIFYDHYVR
ncbi:hypothetical protein KR222_007240 [Zaprionus bogoriensis]|nr:hypothetical protein KR222_007240 [Zaprionus bogoriensis]